MIKKKNIIALIPAKKHSNRLSEKNLKKIGRNKKKLIWFSINAALKSKYISNVIVSTDCNKIKSYAEKFGAKTPFMRSKKLCLNNTKMLDVIKHALTKIDNKDNKIDAVVLLQPTSPLRDNKDIDAAIKFFYEKKADYVASFTKAKPIDWYYKLTKGKSFQIKKLSKNTKKYDNYLINGSIYIYNSKILKKERINNIKSYGFVMPYTKSVDIDEIDEFKVAEVLLNNR